MNSRKPVTKEDERAAQRLNLQTTRKKKKHQVPGRSSFYHTNFGDLVKLSPPPLPPGLIRMTSKRATLGLGKVKVMLRISQSCGTASCLTVNTRKKQVAVYDPPNFPSQSAIPASLPHQAGITPPKMFAFDAVFTPEDNQSEICATVLMDILPAVVSGTNGCVFSYGYSGLGKTETMLGQGRGSQDVGIIPCAISWLFQLISDQKDKSGSRFSVRVSAVEVAGKEQTIRDLLASATESGGKSTDSFLQDDALLVPQLANLCALQVSSAEKTAYLLDVALSARQKQASDEDSLCSHFCFVLHVYQYRAEKGCKVGVTGGRSHLYLFDFGSFDKHFKPRDRTVSQTLSLPGLGSVLLALFNGQKHVPYRNENLTKLVTMALGTLNCRAVMMVHISPSLERSAETLFIVQLASRLHRLRQKKLKQFFYQTSGKLESKDVCQPCVKSDAVSEDETASRVSDSDYTSGSEQSCITAIFVGNTDISRERCSLNKEKSQRVQKYFSKPSKSQTTSNEADPQLFTVDTKKLGVSGRKGPLSKLSSSSSSGLKVRNQKKFPNSAILIQQVPNQNQVKDSVGSLSNSQSTNTQYLEVSFNQSPHKVSIKQHHETTKQNHPGPSCPSTLTKIPMSKREQNIPSDELWIDGPRFTKPKFDPKTLQHLQKEQWVDGPAMCEPCDEIKRSMIRRWVRKHSSSLHLDPGEAQPEVWIDLPETSASEDRVLLYSRSSDANSKRSLVTDTKKQFHSIKPTISNVDKDQAQLECESNNKTYLKSENYSRNVLMDKDCIKENNGLFMSSQAKYGMDGLYDIFNTQINSKDLTSTCSRKEECSNTAITDSGNRISEFNRSEVSDISLSDDENDESNELIQVFQSLHSVSYDSLETSNLNDLEEETEMQDSSVQVSEEDILDACKDTRSSFSENPLPEVDQLQFIGRFYPLRIYSEDNIHFQNEEQEIIEISEKLESLSLPDEYKSDYDNSYVPLLEPGCGQAFYSDGLRQRKEGGCCFSVRSNALPFKLKRLTELREQSQQIRKKIAGLDLEPLKNTKEKWSTMPSWLSRPLISHTFNHNCTSSDEDLISEDALSVKSEPVEATMSANPMNRLQLETFYEELHRMHSFPRFISSFVNSPKGKKNNEQLKEEILTTSHEQMCETRHNNQFFDLNSEQDVENLNGFDKQQLLETLSYSGENSTTRLNTTDKDRDYRQDLLANFPRRSESLDTGLADCYYRNKIYSSQE
ncbi:uncharacterized protein LOC143229593 [Tachypleus tridentatus]|uniref:uncharacterized protein LOC143229593 n=1 Tax=Tachypleus tridentatus TaxID=6853 RepID=UPI003FD5FB53